MTVYIDELAADLGGDVTPPGTFPDGRLTLLQRWKARGHTCRPVPFVIRRRHSGHLLQSGMACPVCGLVQSLQPVRELYPPPLRRASPQPSPQSPSREATDSGYRYDWQLTPASPATRSDDSFSGGGGSFGGGGASGSWEAPSSGSSGGDSGGGGFGGGDSGGGFGGGGGE